MSLCSMELDIRPSARSLGRSVGEAHLHDTLVQSKFVPGTQAMP
jgi:hypothetical protein